MLPVCLARLTDVGLEEGSHCIADKGMEGFIGGVLTQSQHSHLGRDGLVCIHHSSPLNEGQAGTSKTGAIVREQCFDWRGIQENTRWLKKTECHRGGR